MIHQQQTRLRATATFATALCLCGMLGLALWTPAASADSAKSDAAASDSAAASDTADWYEGLDCTQCHTRQIVEEGDDDLLITKHSSMTCVMCHDDSETLAKMHEDAEEGQRIPKTLKRTTVPDSACTVCHQSASTDEADKAEDAAATTDSAETTDATDATATAVSGAPQIPTGITITDANGLEVDVHNIPENSDHEASVTCGSCHAMHKDKSAEKLATSTCTTCHHKNVFECHTCH